MEKNAASITTSPIPARQSGITSWNKLKALLSSTNSHSLRPALEEEDDLASEEEDGVEELLFGAQMDLIAHHPVAASIKLEKAALLGSSAACATLASMYSKGTRLNTRQQSISPSSPPLLAQPVRRSRSNSTTSNLGFEEIEQDSLKAAKWAYQGLAIEFEKPVDGISDDSNLDGDSAESISEDGHEGVSFGLERALDLVIGLTDSFRFGTLRPRLQDGVNDEAAELWEKGAILAQKALAHPAVLLTTSDSDITTKSNEEQVDNSTLTPSSLASRPLLVPNATSNQSSRRNSSARSYTHASTSMPVLSHHHSPTVKLQLTIQVHLLYLLALQIWPKEKAQAERLWKEVIKVAGGVGVIGTKEGDDIVKKTYRRLEQLLENASDSNDWKAAKAEKKQERKKSMDLSTSATSAEDAYFPFGSLRRETGDALSGIWKLKKDKAGSRQNSAEWDTKEQQEIVSPSKAIQSSLIFTDLGSSQSSNLSESRPTAILTTRNLDSRRSDSGHGQEASDVIIGSRTSKFHFAEDYPSPPQSPTSTTRSRRTSSHSPPPTNAKLSPKLNRNQLGPIPFPNIKHKGSSSSFQPPTLLPRVRSSASVSTLPPDFFSTRLRGVNGSNLYDTHNATTKGSCLNPYGTFASSGLNSDVTVNSIPNASWKESIRSRATSIRFTSMRAASSIRARIPFGMEPKEKSATSILQAVLKRNDNSGMYWANVDENEEEIEEVVEREEEIGSSEVIQKGKRPANPFQPPNLRAARSFVDPTRPSITISPSTSSTNLPPLSAKTISSNSNQIDPLLLALEKASRVGVRTKCFTCSKKGLNFPACPKCSHQYCSRACRISKEGGGDGMRHSCGVDLKGKGRA